MAEEEETPVEQPAANDLGVYIISHINLTINCFWVEGHKIGI